MWSAHVVMFMNFYCHWELIVFWTLSIVRIKYKNIKSRRFGSWFFFHLQVKGGETPTQMGPLDRANLNHWSNEGRRTSFRNVVILYFYILSGRRTKSRRQLVLNVIHHRQNLLEFILLSLFLLHNKNKNPCKIQNSLHVLHPDVCIRWKIYKLKRRRRVTVHVAAQHVKLNFRFGPQSVLSLKGLSCSAQSPYCYLIVCMDVCLPESVLSRTRFWRDGLKLDTTWNWWKITK
jgi:hypothetical protein